MLALSDFIKSVTNHLDSCQTDALPWIWLGSNLYTVHSEIDSDFYIRPGLEFVSEREYLV